MNSSVRTSSRLLRITAPLWVALLLLHDPVRHLTLSIVRLPFTVVKGFAGALLNLPRLPALARENAAIQESLLQRQTELAQLREALRASQAAQQLLQSTPDATGSVAAIISRSTIPTQQTVLLDRGAAGGLSLDSVIMDAGGVVGRVTEVHPNTALVMLLTDPESRVAALVERSRETGLLIGRGLGQCELIYLDVHADLNEGDRILTAGLGGVFPKGLVLGTVVHVRRDEEAGTASATVQPAAKLGRLEEVLCLQ